MKAKVKLEIVEKQIMEFAKMVSKPNYGTNGNFCMRMFVEYLDIFKIKYDSVKKRWTPRPTDSMIWKALNNLWKSGMLKKSNQKYHLDGHPGFHFMYRLPNEK